MRAELGLTHTGRNVDDDALFLAPDHLRKNLGQLPVVRTHLEARVHMLGELNHVRSRRPQRLEALGALQQVHRLYLLGHPHVGQAPV